MLPLWDTIARAQNGHGAEILARQFALNQAQAQAAIDALLPAFSAGLKRNAADPMGLSALMSASAGGQYAKYFEDASRAFSPQGQEDGNSILNQIFGSKELSRAVAAQAAQATGIGQEIIKQMLPVLAAMLAGGFLKQFSGALGGAGNNPFAEMMASMMRAGAQNSEAPQQPPAPETKPGAGPLGEMFANPWNRAFGEMWGLHKAGNGPQAAGSANPFLAMAEQWMRAGAGTSPAKPSRNEEASAANPFADALGQMFETGRKQRDDYLRGVDQIFEQFARSGAKSA